MVMWLPQDNIAIHLLLTSIYFRTSLQSSKSACFYIMEDSLLGDLEKTYGIEN